MHDPMFPCTQGCSTRETVHMIPEAERAEHDAWHTEDRKRRATRGRHANGTPWNDSEMAGWDAIITAYEQESDS